MVFLTSNLIPFEEPRNSCNNLINLRYSTETPRFNSAFESHNYPTVLKKIATLGVPFFPAQFLISYLANG